MLTVKDFALKLIVEGFVLLLVVESRRVNHRRKFYI